MIINGTARAVMQHNITGEIFVVRVESGMIVAQSIPLHHSEVDTVDAGCDMEDCEKPIPCADFRLLRGL